MIDPNQYIKDLTERYPSDREDEALCDCGCGAKEGYCKVDDEVDEALLERD